MAHAPRLAQRFAHRGGAIGVAEDKLRFGDRKRARQFACAGTEGDGIGDGARQHRGDQQHSVFQRVLRDDCHPVARLDAIGLERGGETGGPVAQFTECQGFPIVPDCRIIRLVAKPPFYGAFDGEGHQSVSPLPSNAVLLIRSPGPPVTRDKRASGT